MLAATTKSLYDMYTESPEVLSLANINIILIGSVVAFIISILAIKFLITNLQKNGFRVFGWYRIFIGFVLLILIYAGYIKG